MSRTQVSIPFRKASISPNSLNDVDTSPDSLKKLFSIAYGKMRGDDHTQKMKLELGIPIDEIVKPPTRDELVQIANLMGFRMSHL